MSEWTWLTAHDWAWAYSTKMLVTLGILAAWWALSLCLGTRVGRFIGDRRS